MALATQQAPRAGRWHVFFLAFPSATMAQLAKQYGALVMH
jgi:hypothetical protein